MNKKSRGVISIFLTIILVPCLAVSSIFVDLSRVHLSKSVAKSSADLALNSLMTNYDFDLSDWYGMAASCQNIDDFYKFSAEYFERMLKSQGISEEEITLLSDYYQNTMNPDGENIADMLSMECNTSTDNMIQPLEGADLTNAVILEEQVVEFMKYRAPIELTTGIIDRLNKDSTVQEALEQDDNKPMVEDKREFYKAEGELLIAAVNTYFAIHEYQKKAEEMGLSNEKLGEYTKNFENYKEVYAQIHKIMITNLYNTSNLTQYHRITKDRKNYEYEVESQEFKETEAAYTKKETIDEAEKITIDEEKAKKLIEELKEKIEDFEEVKKNFEISVESLVKKNPGEGDQDANPIQWWVRMNKAINEGAGSHTKKLEDSAEEMLKVYAKAFVVSQCKAEGEPEQSWESDWETAKSKIIDLHDRYLTAGVEDDEDVYLKAVTKLEKISKENIYLINVSGNTVVVDGRDMSIESALRYIADKLQEMKTGLSDCIKYLDIAINGRWALKKSERVRSLDKLVKLAQEYQEKFKDWEDTTKRVKAEAGTDMSTECLSEIEEIKKNQGGDGYNKINKESVQELKERLTYIQSRLETFVDYIDKLKYGNSELFKINSFDKFKNKCKISEEKIGLLNQELKNYAASTFAELFKPENNSVLTSLDLKNENYDPKLNPASREVKVPEIYIYMWKQFGNSDKEKIKNKKDEIDEGEKDGNETADAAKEKGRYHGGGTDITKDFSGDEVFSLASGTVSGCMNLIEVLTQGDITSIRDDLYGTAYMMNMFTYATYEREGMYDLVEKKEELSMGSAPTEYNKVKGSETEEETWLSTRVEDFYNKSLTNKQFNRENNTAYEAEIEYILFGGTNEDNVKNVYNNIYAIRFGLNLVSCFQHYWNGTAQGAPATARVIQGVATALQSITQGVIPIPVTKAVLLPILAVMETSTDMERLEMGFPVELYKKEEDWWNRFNPSEIGVCASVGDFTRSVKNIFSGKDKIKNPGKGLFYSDYLTMFVYLGLNNDDTSKVMYQRMSEIMQANIRKISGEDSYSMKNAKVYFQLKAEVREKPLMFTLPIFNEYDSVNKIITNKDWCTYDISVIRGYR